MCELQGVHRGGKSSQRIISHREPSAAKPQPRVTLNDFTESATEVTEAQRSVDRKSLWLCGSVADHLGELEPAP